ncbi:unnamed protein product [Symbiodinium sp. KB8]|nr:unnamed protein product [Symbiodinium sp. KB8]
MSLQGNDPYLVDQLYTSKDCHFRPAIAEKAIGLLLGRAHAAMKRSRPNSVHILVVCSWNVKGDSVHQEMHASAELSQAKTLQEVGSIAARHSHKPWILRRYLEPGAKDRSMPKTAFQTYIHDDMPGPREVFKNLLSDLQRTFCNDENLFTTLTLHAGEHGAHLCSNLKQPAHRADIFRYIYHYTHGGLYIDIKFGFKVTFDYLQQLMARDWGSAQQQLSQERGIKKDHIFQGIIHGQPKHPLFMRAIAHAFSKEIFTKVANLEYMIFCKALWRFLRDDMKQEPAVGWNISPTYGPIYLLQEMHSHTLKSKGDMGNDGHYFDTKKQFTVAYTRCWEWQKGFKGDPRTNERRATTMLQGLPQAVADAMDARRVIGPDQEGALPGGELISDDVQASINNNNFEEIMEAVTQEKHYGGISAEDVMRCIPRGMILHPEKPGWISCRGIHNPVTDPLHWGQQRPPQKAEGEKNNWSTMSDSSSDVAASDGPAPWEESVEVDTMEGVEYQGPVTIHAMIDPEPGPSLEDQENALPTCDKIIKICQSDEMFTWIHALATILVINEKAVIGGLKVSEQLKVWQDRIRILKKPPWIFAPLNLVKTEVNTTWAEAMTARPVMGTDGLLTIALGEGPAYRVLPKITGFFGIISALFHELWDQTEMHETLETDDNFEIVASTIKAIYDQTCRSCGLINRLIIYMPKEGQQVRKCALTIEWGTRPQSKSCYALTNVSLRTKALSQTRDRKTILPTLASIGMTTRGGTPRIGHLRQAHGAGKGNLRASGQNCGASGRTAAISGGSANLLATVSSFLPHPRMTALSRCTEKASSPPLVPGVQQKVNQ